MHIKRPSHLIDVITQMSYPELFLLWVGNTTTFAILYTVLSYVPGSNGLFGMSNDFLSARFLDALYYSITTATSVGYGDIVPIGFSRVFASIQSIISVFVFAVFVTKLVSRRQEIALREVHKLSFEDIFHNIREELYIIRKDFDHLIETAVENHEFDDEDWLRLTIGYQQISSILKEIPDFYDGVNNLYTIDAGREDLLHEAVHRTLHRTNQLLDVLSSEGIDWISNEQSVMQLRDLVETSQIVAELWKRKSPYQKEESFERIVHIGESIHVRIKDELPARS